MTEEERARLEKARKTNRKRILIAAVVIAVAVIVTLLIYEFGSRNPIDDDPGWPYMVTDSMEDGATVFGKSHFYPAAEFVKEVTLIDREPVDEESMKLMQDGRWEKYDPEAEEIRIECHNGVVLTIAKFWKGSSMSKVEYYSEVFPNGYIEADNLAYAGIENRDGEAFLFVSEFSDGEDKYHYSYWFEAEDMTYEEGSTAINAIFDSLRQYE